MEDFEVNEILSGYIRMNLSPTQRERDMISGRYEELRKGLPRSKIFQTGSYARFTSTTPVHDLDVIFEIPQDVQVRGEGLAGLPVDTENLHLTNIIETLAKELQEYYEGKAEVRPQPHSVGVFFNSGEEFSIDVVPAIPTANGLYMIPEAGGKSIAARRNFYESNPKLEWILTDPKGYIEQAKDIDKKSNGEFRKSTKFIKKWKQYCEEEDKNYKFKSFHIEQILVGYFKMVQFQNTFAVSKKFFAQLREWLSHPQLADRAQPDKFIDEYVAELTEGQRANVFSQGQRASECLAEMESASTRAEVISAIEKLLGKDAAIPQRVSRGPEISVTPVAMPWCAD